MRLAPRYSGPPVMTLEGRSDDQALPVSRQRRRLETLLHGLDEAQWAAPSRCDGWTVQDVVAHLVGVNAFWDASIKAGVGGDPTQLLDGFDPAATPPLMVGGMRQLSPGEVLAQFTASNEALLGTLAGLDEAGWSAHAEAPPGHVSVRVLAHHALWDCWVHERDIAIPLAITPALEDDELASCLRYAAALSPALALGAGAVARGTYAIDAHHPAVRCTLEVGESVTVRDGLPVGDVPVLRGDTLELIESLSIRAPLPTDMPAEWRGVLRGLATAFDSDLALD